MTSIDRTAFRDLWKMKGQALAIALVIGCGVAMYIMTNSGFVVRRRLDHLDLVGVLKTRE